MQTPSIAYLTGAFGAVASRVMSIVAGVLSLWFLTRILGVEDLAGYVSAMAVTTMVGYAASLGIERSMLLRISEMSPRRGRLAGGALMLRIAALVLALSLAATLLLVGLAGALPGSGDGRTDEWIRRLAPLVPAIAVSLVMAHWYQANHRVGLSQAMAGIGDLTRSAAFALVFAFGFGAAAVAVGAFVGAALPVAVLALLAVGRTEPSALRLRPRDLPDGLQFVVIRISTMGLRQLDIAVLGFLAGGAEVAAYAVAARIGDVAQFGKAMFFAAYAPRVRRHRVTGDRAAVAREYRAARVLAFLITVAAAGACLVLGRWALGLFGDFGGGYLPLLLMLCGHLVAGATGNHVTHLAMTDRLRLATLNRIAALGLFVGLLLALIPPFGGVGAATAFLLATLFHEATGCALLYRAEGLVAVGPGGLAALTLALTGILIVALFGAAPWLGAAFLLASALLTLGSERRMLARALRMTRG